MSTRWMAVQYVGDILRIPVANESDMSMPFGSSTLERDVRRIVANPFSDSPQVFVPKAENAKLKQELEAVGTASYLSGRSDLKTENTKLRELAAGISHLLFPLDVDYCATCPRDDINHPCPVHTVGGGECLYKTDLRELGVEVDG